MVRYGLGSKASLERAVIGELRSKPYGLTVSPVLSCPKLAQAGGDPGDIQPFSRKVCLTCGSAVSIQCLLKLEENAVPHGNTLVVLSFAVQGVQ